MSNNTSHIMPFGCITTSGGLMSAAFIESIRESSIQRAGVEAESFDLPWREAPKGAAALEDQMATAWELLREQWDAVRNFGRGGITTENNWSLKHSGDRNKGYENRSHLSHLSALSGWHGQCLLS